MAGKTKFGLKKAARDAYLELVLAFPLASIKSAEHLDEAQRIMDRHLAKSTISEILSGKKPFSRQMIRTLAEYFRVDLGVLAANL